MNAPLLGTSDLPAQARRDEHTEPWFDALADGRLTVQTCGDCGHAARPDAAACPRCHCEDLAWSPAEGTGTVVAVVTDHAPIRAGEDARLLGLVELTEGPWLLTRLLDGPAVGDPVTLVVLRAAEGEHVPAFRAV